MRYRSFENGEIGKKFFFCISVSRPDDVSNPHSQPHFRPKQNITKRTPDAIGQWSTRTQTLLHPPRSEGAAVWGSFLWHQVFSFDGVAEFGDRVLVGDSIRRDIVPAKALGMLVVHAVYGDRNFHEEERDGADFVISGIGDVIGVIGREE